MKKLFLMVFVLCGCASNPPEKSKPHPVEKVSVKKECHSTFWFGCIGSD